MASHPVPIRPVDDPDQPSCTIWYIQLKTGRHDYSVDRMCSYVAKLIDQHNFPKPFPRLKKRDLTTEVSDKSRWPRFAVDQWLEDWLPPDAAIAAERERQAQAAATMDTRAARLQLVKGGRR